MAFVNESTKTELTTQKHKQTNEQTHTLTKKKLKLQFSIQSLLVFKCK